MYLDAFTLSALVDEFMDTLVGGRVQDVIDVDPTGLGLEIYSGRQRQYLYLSADHHTPRVHRVADKLRRGLVKPTQLGLLFRRFIEGGALLHVSQPAWERIIQLEFSGPEGPVVVIVEPMERRSNILLVQNGVILDCMRRVGPEDNRYRLSLPNHEYKLPPPQTGRLNPLMITQEVLESLFEANSDPKRRTQQVLSAGILGISPLLASEIVFQSGAEVSQKAIEVDPVRLVAAMQSIMEPLGKRRWAPGMVMEADRARAYSVYPISHLAGWQVAGDLSSALASYYGAAVGEDAYRAAKVPVQRALEAGLAKLRSKLASLERSLKDESERELLKQSGELILAYQYTLVPGQTELVAAYELDQPPLTIRIDPALSPLENAQAYFSRYDKAKRALDDVPTLVAETRAEMDFLAQLQTDLEFAASWPEIDEVQQALQGGGYWQGQPTKRIAGSGQSAPLRVVTQDGFVIWVGRNSRQNELVTFGKGGGQDYWLHARGVPGAHVVVKFDGRLVPESVLEQAASLAAYYSANRAEGKVPVDVTRCLHVRKIKGAAAGMVTYRNEETRLVPPRSEFGDS